MKLILSFFWRLILVLGIISGLAKTAVAQPQWQTRQITIALIPEKNQSDQLRRYRYLSNYLAAKLNIHIRLDLVSYDRMSDVIKNKKAQAGFFGSFCYVKTRQETGIIPVARPVWANGESTYSGYLITRKDKGVKTLSDLKNKSLVLVSKNTTAGYVFPKAYLLEHGINSLDSFFSSVVYAGTHEGAAWTVYYNEADVGALKNHIFNGLKRNYPDFAKSMTILAESDSVPSNTFAVAPELEPGLIQTLTTALLQMHENPEGRVILLKFGAIRFIPTADQDYQPCYDMIKKAQLDPS